MKQPEICKECLNWERYKEKCYFIWEGKKVCTKYLDLNGMEKFKGEKQSLLKV